MIQLKKTNQNYIINFFLSYLHYKKNCLIYIINLVSSFLCLYVTRDDVPETNFISIVTTA